MNHSKLPPSKRIHLILQKSPKGFEKDIQIISFYG